MPRRSMWAVVSMPLALSLLALSGCGELPFVASNVCTLIGCANGLTVQLAVPMDGPFTVEVRTDPGSPNGATHTYRCDGNEGCRRSVFFQDLFPSRARITVTSARGERSTEVTAIRYETRYPNGERCPPPCVNGTVTVNVPT